MFSATTQDMMIDSVHVILNTYLWILTYCHSHHKTLGCLFHMARDSE